MDNIKCCECERENLQPGDYVTLHYDDDDDDTFYIMCNPCNTKRKYELYDSYRMQDYRYP